MPTSEKRTGWTIDTSREQLMQMLADLRGHFESRLADADARYQQRFEAQQSQAKAATEYIRDAGLKSEAALEKRFESVNEFRAQLADQVATFVPRAEHDERYHALTERVAFSNSRLDKIEARTSGLHAGWGYLVGLFGLLGAVATAVALFIRR